MNAAESPHRYDTAASARVAPSRRPAAGRLAVPGSKSLTNRALLLAAMAEGRSTLRGALDSDDSYWCRQALLGLGVGVDWSEWQVVVDGIGRRRPLAQGELLVGSAGTVARFLPGLLAAGEPGQWSLVASPQMTGRPMGDLLAGLRRAGASIECLGRESFYPLFVRGSSFRGGTVRMSGAVSSQFISGVAIAAALAQNPTRIEIEGGVVQSDYVRMTLETMACFGGAAATDAEMTFVEIEPTGYRACDFDIEADASTATYFSALPALLGGEIEIVNLPSSTKQPDIAFLDILARMGCRVDRRGPTVRVSREPNARLRGGFDIDMRPLSDSALTLAALAPFADAPIAIHGVEHIRHHECDRIAAFCSSLAALGVDVDEHEDGMTVRPGRPTSGRLETHDDHRIAMALSLVGLGGDGVELLNPGCVRKTCPPYFSMLEKLGLDVSPCA